MPTSPRRRRSPTPRRGRNRVGGLSEAIPISTQYGIPTFHVSYRIYHAVTLRELYEDIGIFANQVNSDDVGGLVSQSHATVTQIDDDESEVGYYIVAQDVDEYLEALEFHLRTDHPYYRHDTAQVKPVEWSPSEQ